MADARRLFACLALGVSLAAALPGGRVAAQSCSAMQAELMQLKSRGGSPADQMRYERAYRQQAEILARTEQQARAANCFGGGFFFFRPAPQPACNVLVPKIREMQANLDRLDTLRRRGGYGTAARMEQLQGMMSERGCGMPGGNVYEAQPQDQQYYNPAYGRGTYRTLCVRSCDGYYFPISFSTTPDRFSSDAQTCQSMCPGADAQLFYYPNPGGGPESMVSLAGQPYASLPTAFQYRTSLNPSCTCRPAGGYQASAPLSTPAQGVAVDLTAPPPIPRPEPGEDPETMADRAGNFVPHAVAADGDAGTPVASSMAGQIRVVGPPLGSAAQDALMLSPVPN